MTAPPGTGAARSQSPSREPGDAQWPAGNPARCYTGTAGIRIKITKQLAGGFNYAGLRTCDINLDSGGLPPASVTEGPPLAPPHLPRTVPRFVGVWRSSEQKHVFRAAFKTICWFSVLHNSPCSLRTCTGLAYFGLHRTCPHVYQLVVRGHLDPDFLHHVLPL